MKKYRKALVLGLGASGIAAAELLRREGSEVTIVDKAAGGTLLPAAETLRKKGIDVRLGVGGIPDGAFEVCITSPGIASDSPWIRTVESRGVEVLSELELGATRCRCPMAAITGSNGKSTLVKLCGESLAAAGARVEMAGNYGTPLSEFALRSAALDWVVVEVSSFQLEKVKTFKPKVGVLLNVNPNHLNRHGDFATYREIKSRLFARMEAHDTGAVQDSDIETLRGLVGDRVHWVSFGRSDRADYRYGNGAVRYPRDTRQTTVSVAGTVFDNDVMGITAAAAVAVTEACGVGGHCVGQAAKAFHALPHRMNTVATIGGVKFIDDSKATNLAAMTAALEMCKEPVRLIAGGQLKESDLAPVGQVLARKVKGLYLIGDAAAAMLQAWSRFIPCHPCGELSKALSKAWDDAKPGEVILLSPACASFDQFGSFEERGNRFAELVRNINKEN